MHMAASSPNYADGRSSGNERKTLLLRLSAITLMCFLSRVSTIQPIQSTEAFQLNRFPKAPSLTQEWSIISLHLPKTSRLFVQKGENRKENVELGFLSRFLPRTPNKASSVDSAAGSHFEASAEKTCSNDANDNSPTNAYGSEKTNFTLPCSVVSPKKNLKSTEPPTVQTPPSVSESSFATNKTLSGKSHLLSDRRSIDSSTISSKESPATQRRRSIQKPLRRAEKSQVYALNLAGKCRNETLTVDDLEKILMSNGYLRLSDLPSEMMNRSNPMEGIGQSITDQNLEHIKKENSPGSVAFPQPSLLSYRSIKWGSTVASGLVGAVLGVSVLPSFWLIGALLGGLFGHETAKQLPERPPPNAISTFVIQLGRRFAKVYLSLYDTFQRIWFMYKTGQLSYDYYKQYESLDQRFAIQAKVDAWNARFVEGKIAFDRWEKENEIGRKALAALRTFWLVEESSLKKTLRSRRRQSRYRFVQIVYDAAYWIGRSLRSILNSVTGRDNKELHEFLEGLRMDLSESRVADYTNRVTAVFVALLGTNLIGALFIISPLLVSSGAVLVGIMWPTWTGELWNRVLRYGDQTRAKGRGDKIGKDALQKQSRKVDQGRYHFFVDLDGKKRYYRVGQHFARIQKPEDSKARRSVHNKSMWGFFESS